MTTDVGRGESQAEQRERLFLAPPRLPCQVAPQLVARDREQPRLIDAKVVTPRPQIPGEIEVIVRAKDATGMKRYAWATLKGGNVNKTVRLLLIDKSSGIYRKAMTVSGLSTGQLTLINVRLEDYVGNMHVYDIE